VGPAAGAVPLEKEAARSGWTRPASRGRTADGAERAAGRGGGRGRRRARRRERRWREAAGPAEAETEIETARGARRESRSADAIAMAPPPAAGCCCKWRMTVTGLGGLFVGFCGGVSSLGFRILVYVSLVAKAETGEW